MPLSGYNWIPPTMSQVSIIASNSLSKKEIISTAQNRSSEYPLNSTASRSMSPRLRLPHSRFTQFSRLPLEIRRMIWRAAMDSSSHPTPSLTTARTPILAAPKPSKLTKAGKPRRRPARPSSALHHTQIQYRMAFRPQPQSPGFIEVQIEESHELVGSMKTYPSLLRACKESRHVVLEVLKGKAGSAKIGEKCWVDLGNNVVVLEEFLQ